MATDPDNPTDPKNPRVFFDISMGEELLGRVKMELFANTLPRTAENFRQFCTGEAKDRQGQSIGYKNCKIHRVVPKFMIQGGDFINGDGTGSACIYGDGVKFDDEKPFLRHNAPGVLSMANSGPNTNGSQFFITIMPATWLDGSHVVFGRVVDGMNVVEMLDSTRLVGEKPASRIYISQCGEL